MQHILNQKRSIDRLIRQILSQISAREKRISEKVHPNSGTFKESHTRFYRGRIKCARSKQIRGFETNYIDFTTYKILSK